MNFYKKLDKYSANTAIITEQIETISYKKLLELSDNIGKHVKTRSLVFAVCKNSFESIAGYIGFARADAVSALINYTIAGDLFANLLKAYRPRYIYIPKEKLELLKADHIKLGSFGGYILLRTKYDIDYTVYDQLALLLSTSGTTGSPKLVRQSYKNIYSNAKAIAEYLQIKNTDKAITTMPMNYTYGLSIINSHLFKGASIIATNSSLMEKSFWELIKKSNPATFGGVPYIYEMLKRLRFERINLPSIKYITQAGGKLDPKLAREFIDICIKKGIKFYIMYGQTEATARMSYLPWEHAYKKADSIGIPIKEGRFILKDENNNIIEKADTAGELIYEGDNVSLGYAKSRFDLCKQDENNGVLYTGDIVKKDSDGFYYIVGRKKRFLKMFGNRVNLNELEEFIRANGYDCACVGEDNNLKIYIKNINDKKALINSIEKRLKISRVGITIININKIPRNNAGKILYSAFK